MEDTAQVEVTIRKWLSWKHMNKLLEIFLDHCNIQLH